MSGSDDDRVKNPFAGLDPRVLETEKDDGVKDALNTLLGASGGTGKPTGTVPRQTRNSQKTGAGITVDPPEKKDCDPSVKRSNRLLSQLASQRHN